MPRKIAFHRTRTLAAVAVVLGIINAVPLVGGAVALVLIAADFLLLRKT